ncbi:MAG TPA: GNAT family protein [Propionibacteriaceae bacterium]
MSTDWRERVDLEGPRLRLTPLVVADAPAFRAGLGTPQEAAEVVQHLSFAAPKDDDEARAHLVKVLADPNRVAYAIRIRESGAFIGTTSFYEIDPDLQSLAIGHTWIARTHWRTSVNTEAKLVLLTRTFEGLGAERVVWHTDIRNTRSQQAIARLGAQREGVLRHHRRRLDGSWRDTVQYSMLKDEWPAVRQQLTAALDARR